MSKEKDILRNIADTGHCETLSTPSDICKTCPLSKLKRRSDGTGWLSCFEAIAGPTFENVTEKYKIAAQDKLLELEIYEKISEES